MSDTYGALGVIPARAASSRFPLKVLAKIQGKSLLQRVWEQVTLVKELSRVIVAVDHPEVEKHVLEFGGEPVMTPPELQSGTDRVFYASRELSFPLVVNIQGDEPLISPLAISKLIQCHFEKKEFDISTLVVWKRHSDELKSPHVVKCVRTATGRALYFSRQPIATTEQHEFWKHIGIYAFRRESLERFCQLPKSALELNEKLEQLRALENNMSIQVVECDEDTIAVDTPEDILRVEQVLRS